MCVSDEAKQLRVLTKSVHQWHRAKCHINCRITPLKKITDFWGGMWQVERKQRNTEWIINRSFRKAEIRNKLLCFFFRKSIVQLLWVPDWLCLYLNAQENQAELSPKGVKSSNTSILEFLGPSWLLKLSWDFSSLPDKVYTPVHGLPGFSRLGFSLHLSGVGFLRSRCCVEVIY